MAAIHDPLLALLLLLAICGLHCSSPRPSCPDSCRCPWPSVLNCSASGLSVMSPRHIQDFVAELDFSHNLLEGVVAPARSLRRLRSVRLGNNSIARLSLCIQRQRRVKGHGCVAWAPDLQLLSAERNRLRRLPEGLPALEALEVLQLSFNNISSIQPGELHNLHQLRELHLQHNLISSLQPHAIQHLNRLKLSEGRGH
ncbi:biglycan-like [Nerophis lumbriciformis]|uniref:biglycan-like n=1 Tax=Nerophis lumbriciformis TaxID=546530 RepID=UPI002AE029EA|nr:leucine-rich repeat-containing protein 66-like [Nerophis lumbriciformis]